MAARKKSLDPIAELEVQIEKLSDKLDKARFKKVSDAEKRVERYKKSLENQKTKVATARTKVADNRKPANAAATARLTRAKASLDVQLDKLAEVKEALRLARADLSDAKLAIKNAKQIDKTVTQLAKSLGVNTASAPQAKAAVSKKSTTPKKSTTTAKSTAAKKSTATKAKSTTKKAATTPSKKTTAAKATSKKSTATKATPKKTAAQKPTGAKKSKAKGSTAAKPKDEAPVQENLDSAVTDEATKTIETTATVEAAATIESTSASQETTQTDGSTSQRLFEQNSLFGDDGAPKVSTEQESTSSEDKLATDDTDGTKTNKGSTRVKANGELSEIGADKPESETPETLANFDSGHESNFDESIETPDDVVEATANEDEVPEKPPLAEEENVISLFDPPAD